MERATRMINSPAEGPILASPGIRARACGKAVLTDQFLRAQPGAAQRRGRLGRDGCGETGAARE